MSPDARAFIAGGAYGLVLAGLTFAFILRHIG